MSLINIPLTDIVTAPLQAVGQSQQQLSQTTLEFIQNIGLESDLKTIKNIEFEYNYTDSESTDPMISVVKIVVPLLVLVRPPSLYITKTEINFDTEVSEVVETEGTNTIPRLTYLAKLTSQQKIRRSTNTSSTYSIKVVAEDKGMPEGLARVLDLFTLSIPSQIPTSEN